jgi:hypothetical protein
VHRSGDEQLTALTFDPFAEALAEPGGRGSGDREVHAPLASEMTVGLPAACTAVSSRKPPGPTAVHEWAVGQDTDA